MDVCEKARDRVDKKDVEARYLDLCFKYCVCPSCGEDMNLIEIRNKPYNSRYYTYIYKCGCGWKGQQHV